MVSIPEEVLRAIDVEADRRGMARSGLVREFAEDSLRRPSVRRAERMAQIHESGGPRAGHGGQAAEIVQGEPADALTLWLLDASVIVSSEDPDDEHHDDAVRLLGHQDPLATLDSAFYEVANVAVRAWQDRPAAGRLRERVVALVEDGGLTRADSPLLADAIAVAGDCDIRDLVSRGLACRPGDTFADPPDAARDNPSKWSPARRGRSRCRAAGLVGPAR